jgi:glycosyltransferase involved in cell wall biosynthesis
MTDAAITTVHQVLPWLHVADAAGAHALHARDALRAAGYASELFVENVDPPLAGEARHVDELDAVVVPGRTALLYQLAVGSAVAERLLQRSEPLLVNYHNLTPASFFWQWEPTWLDAVEWGHEQLHRLAARTRHALSVSEFNRRDLIAAGYRSTSVVPPFVDVAGFPDAGPAFRRHRPDGGARWLFVGKLLPHKGAHLLVEALAAYRVAYDPSATLTLVGSQPVARYAQAVASLAAALGLGDAVRLAGSVPQEELAAAYRSSDVFVCLSRHEGFCFPLLEAMHHGLPVVALDEGAVPDTLGSAGLVVRRGAPGLVAAAVHRVLADTDLRGRLVARGLRRLSDFDLERTKAAFGTQVRTALGDGSQTASS